MSNHKINYDKLFKEEVDRIKQKPQKPTLLLHVCCAPCFTHPYNMLKDYFAITIIYNNSNIYPESEYQRRLDELKAYLKAINAAITIISFPYDNQTFVQDLLPYSTQREGMDRCRLCFQKRLSQAFEYAQQNNFDYCGTAMSISRFK
ncbi:MAG: epoxyqueuosine reductase QueH, partial [Erysipelotrichia bacterium]|nr:epoxyqueuosine reductase QueH [Erysipelotrichia bacterium]